MDASYTPAIDSAESIKSMVVDRWHYRMLNDKQRNVQYKSSITRAICAIRATAADTDLPVTVLDIGGGTGILSMYAALAGADHVYCCEMSPPLAEVARRCITDNGLSGRITVISKHSTDLQVLCC
jgi:type II protein arginine methyltransferase